MTVANLEEALERFFDRLETIQTQTNTRVEEVTKVAASLDKLAEVVANLELQRSQENRLVNKLETLAAQLEELEWKEKPSGKGLERSFRTFVAGAKTLGQVIEIIASGVQTMMDSVVQAINEYRSISFLKG